MFWIYKIQYSFETSILNIFSIRIKNWDGSLREFYQDIKFSILKKAVTNKNSRIINLTSYFTCQYAMQFSQFRSNQSIPNFLILITIEAFVREWDFVFDQKTEKYRSGLLC